MTENTEVTIGEAMETMSDRDLAFIATYNPQAFHAMCYMWSLELELQREGKLISHPPVILKTRKPKNRFVYLWYKLQEWLFSRLLKMVSKR
jgi:hypothetical protein